MKKSTTKPIKENLAKVYDTIAESFDSKRRYPWTEVQNFIKQLQPGFLTLDLGSGNGRHTKLLVERNCNTIGLDISFKILHLSLEKELHHMKSNIIGLLNADGVALPFIRNSFDAVISIAVIHHFSTVESRVLVLKEINRILKRNGVAFISCWLKSHPRFQKEDMKKYIEQNIQDIQVPWKNANGKTIMRYYYLFEPEELTQIAEDIGFKVDHQVISNHNLFLQLRKK